MTLSARFITTPLGVASPRLGSYREVLPPLRPELHRMDFQPRWTVTRRRPDDLAPLVPQRRHLGWPAHRRITTPSYRR
jgi:hypothetical protein